MKIYAKLFPQDTESHIFNKMNADMFFNNNVQSDRDECAHIGLDVEKIHTCLKDSLSIDYDGSYWLIIGIKSVEKEIFTKQHLIIEKIYHRFPMKLGMNINHFRPFIYILLDIQPHPFPFLPLIVLLFIIGIGYFKVLFKYHSRLFSIK